MAERALRWVKTLLQARDELLANERSATGTSGVQPIDLPEELRHATTLGSLRLVADAGKAPEPPLESAPERRERDRRDCAIELEFTEDTHFFSGLSQDISEGGIFVATYERLPIGTHLTLSFELPDGGAVEAKGEVRWVREEGQSEERPGLGIAFTELSGDAREHITRYCSVRPPLYVDV